MGVCLSLLVIASIILLIVNKPSVKVPKKEENGQLMLNTSLEHSTQNYILTSEVSEVDTISDSGTFLFQLVINHIQFISLFVGVTTLYPKCGFLSIESNTGGQYQIWQEHIGDNKCHEFLNRPECGFDEGDCCQEDVRNDVEDTCYGCFCYQSEFVEEPKCISIMNSFTNRER